jgi:hypothetical protein
MNMIYESMRNRGGLVLVPSAALEGMNLGTVLGAKAYHEQTKNPSSQDDSPAHAQKEDKSESDQSL